jgi:hypothetical protein
MHHSLVALALQPHQQTADVPLGLPDLFCGLPLRDQTLLCLL